MNYIEGEYTVGEYEGDGWTVSLEYDGDYDLMNCSWDGCPEGCTQEHFDEVMRQFDEKYFNCPGDHVQEAFEALAKEEGWD